MGAVSALSKSGAFDPQFGVDGACNGTFARAFNRETTIGAGENFPPMASATKVRRYPPGLRMMPSSVRWRMVAMVTAAPVSPIASMASFQALGEIPRAGRTV